MAWTIQPFNNTDLHNIYEAIVSGGGGGGDTLAGLLLNGSVNPDNPSGFYPEKFTTIDSSLFEIYGLLYGDNAPNTALADTYPYWAQHTYTSVSKSLDLLNGDAEPNNIGGFYPAVSLALVNNTSWLQEIYNNIALVKQLLDGATNPSNYTGFYPDTLYKIKENTSNTFVEISKGMEFGTTATGGGIQQRSVDGFSTTTDAAAAAVNYMNSKVGTYYLIGLFITQIAGINGHSYCIVYR